jgi:hypothetical protein
MKREGFWEDILNGFRLIEKLEKPYLFKQNKQKGGNPWKRRKN